MAFRSKAAHPTGETNEASSPPIPQGERKPELPRHPQHSFISPDLQLTGDLKSSSDISVEGSIEGNITCRTLTLRGEPTITGDVHAEAVHVCGRFTGALHAKKVVLTKAAKMTGDIYFETLELQEGAEFEGGVHCTRGSASKAAREDILASGDAEQLVHAS